MPEPTPVEVAVGAADTQSIIESVADVQIPHTVEHPAAMPTFEPQKPTRIQRLTMRAAGTLMKSDGVQDTLERVVKDIGGYEVKQTLLGKQFRAKVKQTAVMSKWDVTAESRPMLKYRSGADHEDATGTDLDTAVARTATGDRNTGSAARTLRGRATRMLVRHATKGVMARGHLQK